MSFFTARRLVVPLAGIVGAAALLTGPTATAATTPAGQARQAHSRLAANSAGSVHTWISGIPAHVRRGSTVTFTLWYRAYTRQAFTPVMFTPHLANSGPYGAGQSRGVTMEFYDPATHRWERPGTGSVGTDPLFPVGGKFGTVRVPAGGVGHVAFRIHFGYISYAGGWRIGVGAMGVTLPGRNSVDGLAWITRFTVIR